LQKRKINTVVLLVAIVVIAIVSYEFFVANWSLTPIETEFFPILAQAAILLTFYNMARRPKERQAAGIILAVFGVFEGLIVFFGLRNWASGNFSSDTLAHYLFGIFTSLAVVTLVYGVYVLAHPKNY